MPFTIIDPDGPIVSVKIAGELGQSEVGQLQTMALRAIKRHGRISALLILENFAGWKPSSEWGDVTFMNEHDNEIARIAVVGEEDWRDMICAFLAKGFRQAEVEYFSSSELTKARLWLAENQRSEVR
ncbi:MAG TPA: STAS/SEC14 domain-containing protein [Candidatus Limnocylindria bacterium]|nr:STAS/SEC14 domain-containing protein [Candidatus Limnocylindria bacterium]